MRATKIKTLLKIHEALQKDSELIYDSQDSLNRSDKQRQKDQEQRKQKIKQGKKVRDARRDIVSRNGWQNIADYLKKAGEEEGVVYPTSKGAIYNYLKIFEDEIGVEFETVNDQQKLYKYPESFDLEVFDDYIATLLGKEVNTIDDFKDYLDAIDTPSTLSMWARLFIKNFSKHKEMLQALSFYESDSLPNYVDLFDELLEHIINKEPIQFYIMGKDRVTQEPKPKLVRMHPYLLKNYNQRWYLIGRVKDEHYPDRLVYFPGVSNFAINAIVPRPEVDGEKLPTIKKWEEVLVDGKSQPVAYDPSGIPNLEAYKAAVGVTIEGNLQTVELRFPTWRYKKYVESKPLVSGDFQKVGRPTPDGQYTDVKLTTYLSKELVQQILSFGPDCEVLQPAELRESVAELVRKAADLYSSTSPAH